MLYPEQAATFVLTACGFLLVASFYWEPCLCFLLFAALESVCVVKNCDLGLENAAWGYRPWVTFSRPYSQYFTILTSQPANNMYFLCSRIQSFFPYKSIYLDSCKTWELMYIQGAFICELVPPVMAQVQLWTVLPSTRGNCSFTLIYMYC